MSGGDEWDGTLTPEEFSSCVAFLCERWKEMDTELPQWAWIPCRRLGASSDVDGYVALENVYRCSETEELIAEVNSNAEGERLDDDASVVRFNNDMHIYDYHIVYSFSYKIPVLYFRGYHCGGQPLKLEEIEEDLPLYSVKMLSETKWTFMTQEEHPYIHRPWYTLHPCGTSDWMKVMLKGSLPQAEFELQNYLPAWLSVVGQAVGLKIPLELCISSVQDNDS